VVPTPEEITTEPATAIPPTAEPAPAVDILDDLAQELFVGYGGAGGFFCDEVPAGPLPVAQGEVWQSHAGWLCLWGFPAGSGVRVELYDPGGQLVAAQDVTVDHEQERVGVAEILVSFAGQPTGQWTIVANAAGMHLEAPFHVAEPAVPVISVVPGGPDLFAGSGPLEFVRIPYAPGDQVAILGAGFPPGQSLPLGIYYQWETESEQVELLYGLAVQTDGQGRFEVHRPVEALALSGEGTYHAIVPLDPSYEPRALGFSPHGALGSFVVPSPGAHAGDVTLLLECGGGPLEDPTFRQAVLYALNRLHLSDWFGGSVTFLFSFQGNAIDATAEPWDPNRARQLLEEGGYGEGVPAEFIYPDGDRELSYVARRMAEDLMQVGISAEVVPVSPADMGSYFDAQTMSGLPVLWLARR
jgi:hypothetical protein